MASKLRSFLTSWLIRSRVRRGGSKCHQACACYLHSFTLLYILWPPHSCKVCPFTAVFTMLHSTRNTHNGKYRVGTAGGEWSEPPCLLLYIIMWPMKVWWLQFSSSWNTYDILWLMHAVHIVHAYTVVIEHCSSLRFQFKSRAIIELVTRAGKYECALLKSSRNVAQQMITDIQNFNLRWKGAW